MTAEKKQKLLAPVLVIMYFIIWAVSVAAFWLTERVDAMGYSIVVFYIALPVATLAAAFFIGKDTRWGRAKWFMILFFGLMYMLAAYFTFSLSNIAAFGNFYLPDITATLPGLIISAIGLAVGTVLERRKYANHS